MGKGIKKISENVIADKRSLILVVSSNNPDDVIANTDAMPLGMLKADYYNKGLDMKIGKNYDGDAIWSKLDADYSLLEESVSTKLIEDQAIVTEKIQDYAVTSKKIQNLTIQPINLAPSSVITDKIADHAVTTIKLDSRSVTNDKLMEESVSSSKIRNFAVITNKLDDFAVTNNKLAENCVTSNKISSREVKNFNIGIEEVHNENIKNQAVTSNKIAQGTIVSSNIAPLGVATGNLQNGCVITEKLGNSAVTTEKLEDHSVTTEKLHPRSLNPFFGLDNLKNVVAHDGNGNINGKNQSTVLNDVYAQRVYNIVYMDIAEGYIPNDKEELEPGDIVAMNEDGKVYKADHINDCIVGVISDEYANCLGATKEELESKEKIAVGMIGKIHVKVKGPVKLGQRIRISDEAGIGKADWISLDNIGKALETVDCDYDTIHKVLVQVRPM